MVESWVGCASALPGLYGVVAASRRALRECASEDFAFTLVTEGGLRSRMRGRVWEAAPGDVLMSNPYELRDCRPCHRQGQSSRTLHVSAQLVRACLGEHDVEVVAPLLMQTSWSSVFDAVFASMREDNPMRTRHLLVPFLSAALRPYTPRTATPDPLDSARALIDAAPATKLSLDTLAETARMSRWHFVRVFGRSVGLPPHAYIVQKRIELARALIRQGHGLAHAASVSGFADQSHMTRVFREKYGLTPSDWARTVR